jgi:GT2 family glycosyltransferase
MPVHNPPADFLDQALEHIRAQSYEHWELCVCDDATTNGRARAVLAGHAEAEPRMKVVRNETAAGIARATNAALALASGEFVVLHDHDDVLAGDALELVAGAIGAHPDADMIYTDNDHLLPSGRRFLPYLKPDWSPDLFRSTMYTCHLGTYRRALVEETGGLRPEFDGAQDYDLVLRIAERGGRIVHVPRIAHHWRYHADSAAAGEGAKPYAYEAGRRAIGEHLRRTGADALAEHGPRRGLYRVRHQATAPAIDVLLALDSWTTRDAGLAEGIEALARGLAGTSAPVRVLAAGSAEALEVCEAALGDGDTASFEGIQADPEAGFAALLGLAASAGSSPLLLWLDGPLEGSAPGWLEALAGHATADGVGAAGGKVLSTEGRVERAGVVVSDGVPLGVAHGARRDDVGAGAGLVVATNRSAVAGAVMASRRRWDELGGLDPSVGRLAEVDFCLRLRALGDRVVLVPDALLRRRGVAAPPLDLQARRRFAARWAGSGPDPFYNPAYWQERASHAIPRELRSRPA